MRLSGRSRANEIATLSTRDLVRHLGGSSTLSPSVNTPGLNHSNADLFVGWRIYSAKHCARSHYTALRMDQQLREPPCKRPIAPLVHCFAKSIQASDDVPLTMSTLTLILGLLILGALIGAALVMNTRKSRDPFEEDRPFYARKLLTPPEQVLYHRLAKALPECIVFTQVQLSRAIGITKGQGPDAIRFVNRIIQKSLDFVVCLPDGTIVTAIELDDSSHKRANRIHADRTKELALKSAGVPLIRWHVAAMPSEEEIRRAIAGNSAAMRSTN